ncbi:MAG: SpoIIE family protein phosphatase [Acidobacteriota bacterium]
MSNVSETLAQTLGHHEIKVLLIDDQPIVADAVRKMLQPEEDIVFHYCQDPSEAIQTATQVQPTVILQDLVMPDIDGLTLAKFIRGHKTLKDVPLIVLSSKEEPLTKAEAFSVGANDYLVKLPDRIELVARIRHHSNGYINLLQKNEAYDALFKSRQALLSELSRAADYVISLLPARLSEGPVSTDWRFHPSAQLGGDCFGYHWIDEDNFAVYLLDVCGHGVGSALLSVSALNALRSQSLPGVDFTCPGKVLAGLNDAFQMQDHNNLYFTIWYGVYNRKTRKLSYSNGGHPPALLISGSGEVSRLMASNFVIGAFPHASYCMQETEVPTPARLYVFSDGVYEVENDKGVMWSLNDLEAFLKTPPPGPESEMDLLYRQLVERHGQPTLPDDFSMLQVKLIE